MGPFQSSAEGLGLRLTEHSKCWYHVIGHNSKAIWRFVKKIYGIYQPPPSPCPSLPSSLFAFMAFPPQAVPSSLTSPSREFGHPKVALCLPDHPVGLLDELDQPSHCPGPGPRLPPPPWTPSFWGFTLAISFPFLFMQM